MKIQINNDSINYFVKHFWKLWTSIILCSCSVNFDVILPKFMFYEDVNTRKWEKVKNSSPKKLSANCRPTLSWLLTNSRLTVGGLSFTAFCENFLPTVGWLLVVCRLTVGSMSVMCQLSVGWEHLLNARKASACREEHCISMQNGPFSLE